MTRMSRAAIVACDDPFVALLFLYFFKKVWSDEVDKLYVAFNGYVDRQIADYVKKRFEEHSKVVWLYDSSILGHGKSLKRGLDASNEDLIVFLDSDAYIYKKGIVDMCFKKIENGECDMVGSPACACGKGILEASIKKFGDQVSPFPQETVYSKCGPHFCPCFLFIRRNELLKTDQDFNSRIVKTGTYIKDLDWTSTNDGEYMDIFVWVSIQLRALGLKVCYVPQCRLSPEHDSIQDVYPFGWIHVGYLYIGLTASVLHGCYEPYIFKLEYARTVAFWKIAVNLEDYSEIAEFKKIYLDGIEKVICHHDLDKDRIAKKVKGFKIENLILRGKELNLR